MDVKQMNIRELQNMAKGLQKSDPIKSCEIYLQAYNLDNSNMFTISQYGTSLRYAKRSKDFLDLCEAHPQKEVLLKNNHVLSSICWCKYDHYIKSFNNNIELLEDFVSHAEFIADNSAQLSGNDYFMNPYVLTIFKVAKVLEKAEHENFERQIDWLNKLNPELLSDKPNTKANDDGESIDFKSHQEQYYQRICWLYYKQTIKPYDELTSKEFFENFIISAEFIVKNCCQLDADNSNLNPYVLTVLKVIKIYNSRENKNFKKILEWVQKLNPDILSNEVFKFTDTEGNDREKASPKEAYFQFISKAYEKLQMYQECIRVCDIGLEQIKKWHYRNHIWVRARREYCQCLIADNFDEAINNYKKIAEKERHWFMFHKLSLLYLSHGQIDESLLFGSKALNSGKFDEDKMINLLYDLGMIFQAARKNSDALVFFQACAYYRNRNGWNIQEELKFIISEHSIDITIQPNKNRLLSISKGYLPIISSNINFASGRIKTILKNGDGFITLQNGEDRYFGVKENKGLKVNDLVEFETESDQSGRLKAVLVKRKGV